MRIFLLGFMGCGKSTIGKDLAKKMHFDFIDLDDYITKKEGITIKQIFKKKGELAFRKMEEIALLEVSQKNNIVIATGGGTPCFFENMKNILEKGKSIYLKMRVEELNKILKHQQNQRPLIINKSNEELLRFISSTLSEREQYYTQADFIVEGNKGRVKSILDLLT